MKQKMTPEHRQFLEDCQSMKIYLGYVRTKVKYATSYNEEELQMYHKAYVKLTHSVESFNGSQFRNNITVIMNSIKSQDEKYEDYKRTIKEASEMYNKANILHKEKQIKL
jgi:hypothetical protein